MTVILWLTPTTLTRSNSSKQLDPSLQPCFISSGTYNFYSALRTFVCDVTKIWNPDCITGFIWQSISWIVSWIHQLSSESCMHSGIRFRSACMTQGTADVCTRRLWPTKCVWLTTYAIPWVTQGQVTCTLSPECLTYSSFVLLRMTYVKSMSEWAKYKEEPCMHWVSIS